MDQSSGSGSGGSGSAEGSGSGGLFGDDDRDDDVVLVTWCMNTSPETCVFIIGGSVCGLLLLILAIIAIISALGFYNDQKWRKKTAKSPNMGGDVKDPFYPRQDGVINPTYTAIKRIKKNRSGRNSRSTYTGDLETVGTTTGGTTTGGTTTGGTTTETNYGTVSEETEDTSTIEERIRPPRHSITLREDNNITTTTTTHPPPPVKKSWWK